MFKVGVTNIEDVSRTLIKHIKYFQYIYISYNLLREGSEHESILISHVLDSTDSTMPRIRSISFR